MIFCDNCRYDLTRAGSVPKYRLKLDQEKIPGPTGGYHVHADKPLGEWVDHLHFCGVDCLMGWVNSRRSG